MIYQVQMHTLLPIGLRVKLCFIFDEHEQLIDIFWGLNFLK